ncbi:MAG: hypothetical protein R3302_06450 [Sulfurimonadaceae bacterium]|nr:hypothetical protein [Sulfurimonadaceae bacterium]
MKPALLLLITLCFIGCSDSSDSTKESKTESDHVMRSQIDAMQQAKETRSLVQEQLDARDKAAQEAAR